MLHKIKNLRNNTLQAKGDKSDTFQIIFICYLFLLCIILFNR